MRVVWEGYGFYLVLSVRGIFFKVFEGRILRLLMVFVRRGVYFSLGEIGEFFYI